VLWVAITFAGMLGLGRSFVLEREPGRAGWPAVGAGGPASALYFGKMIVMLLYQPGRVDQWPVFVILFNQSANTLPWLWRGVVVLATIGFAGVGRLFSAMAVYTRALVSC